MNPKDEKKEESVLLDEALRRLVKVGHIKQKRGKKSARGKTPVEKLSK